MLNSSIVSYEFVDKVVQLMFCLSMSRRVHLYDYLEQILGRMQGLLSLGSPDNGQKQHLSPEDQQFMYETAGVLIVQSQFTPQVTTTTVSCS